ncbi:MAG: S1 RNA-binding domain-containing protein, partial [Anaerolineae bacterium]
MESNEQILDQTGESVQSSEVEQPDEADVLEETPAEAEFVDETAPEMVSEEVFEEEPAPEMDEGDFIAEADSDIHEEVAEPVGDEMSDQELFLAAINGEMEDDESDFMFTTLSKGQIVEGTIARMTNSEILVDVGAKTEGIISGRELDALDPELVESWQIGDVLKVFVLTPEDRSGNILLSVRRAKEAEDWEMAADYLESGEIYETKINNFNKGGLLVRFGRLRGFIPASQGGAQRRRR